MGPEHLCKTLPVYTKKKKTTLQEGCKVKITHTLVSGSLCEWKDAREEWKRFKLDNEVE